MSDVDEFLRVLASEGRQDSGGAFTLDMARAAGKLAKFQLRDPRGYLLAVVAAACSGGARRLLVDVRADGCNLDLLGVPLPEPGELKHLFALLLSSVSTPETLWLKYLARAMLAAAGGNPAFVGLAAWGEDGKIRSSLKLVGTDLQSSKAPRLSSVGEAGVRFQVQEHVSGSVLQRLVQAWTGSQGQELDLLRSRCAHAPVLIEVNGHDVRRPVHLGNCTGILQYVGPTPIKASWDGDPNVVDCASPGDFSAVLGWGKAQWGATCALMLHGLTYPIDPDSLGGKGVRGLIACDLMTSDLSLEDLVESEALKDLLDQLRKRLISIREQMAHSD